MSIITTSRDHSYQAGDTIAITKPDRRWWRRLWFFVTFRGLHPTITTTHKITSVTSTTFKV